MIISDTSPLIHLTAIGKLPFLLDLYGVLNISNAVQEEAIVQGIEKGYSDATLLEGYVKSNKIKVLPAGADDPVLKPFLHPGEYESILLAKQMGYLLLIDEQKGRLVAERNGISVITTAGVLLVLLRKKMIDYERYSKNLAKYSARGWLSSDLYHKYLEAGKTYGEGSS